MGTNHGMDWDIEYMSTTTDSCANELLNEDWLDETFRCRLKACYEGNISHSSRRWITPPLHVIAYLKRGKIETTVKLNHSHKVLIWEAGTVISLSPSMCRIHHPIVSSELYYYGVAISFEILHGVDLLTLFELPTLFKGNLALKMGRALIDIIANNKVENSLNKSVASKAYCTELLRLLLTCAIPKEQNFKKLSGLRRLAPVLSHIKDHIEKTPNLCEWAMMAHLSTSRFHAVFKSALGCSPHEYIRQKRLEKALYLLSTTDKTIAEIGNDVGFVDPFHFSKVFKAFFGLAPRDYRKGTGQLI